MTGAMEAAATTTLVEKLFIDLRFSDLPADINEVTLIRLLEECDRRVNVVDVPARLAKVLIMERRLQASKKLSRKQLYERRFHSEYVRRDMLTLSTLLRKHNFDPVVLQTLKKAPNQCVLGAVARFLELDGNGLHAALVTCAQHTTRQLRLLSAPAARKCKTIEEMRALVHACMSTPTTEEEEEEEESAEPEETETEEDSEAEAEVESKKSTTPPRRVTPRAKGSNNTVEKKTSRPTAPRPASPAPSKPGPAQPRLAQPRPAQPSTNKRKASEEKEESQTTSRAAKRARVEQTDMHSEDGDVIMPDAKAETTPLPAPKITQSSTEAAEALATLSLSESPKAGVRSAGMRSNAPSFLPACGALRSLLSERFEYEAKSDDGEAVQRTKFDQRREQKLLRLLAVTDTFMSRIDGMDIYALRGLGGDGKQSEPEVLGDFKLWTSSDKDFTVAVHDTKGKTVRQWSMEAGECVLLGPNARKAGYRLNAHW